ncbi:phosphatase PAP2 family protein [Natronococcus sp.]|uniref:phosphatase PAP2 family protein n=1 Tax=Natronococcus sp. TaxID=35747 RepID=UPI003A4E3C62
MSRSVGATELLREFLPEWTTLLFVALSYPGKLTLLVPLLGLFYLVDVGRTLRSGALEGRPLCSRGTAYVLAVSLGGLAFVVLVKGAFSLPRTDPSLHAVSSSEHGFPSGHVMAAVSTWGALALWTTHSTRVRRLLAAGAVVAVVGLARLALGIHYLVDAASTRALLSLVGTVGAVVGWRTLEAPPIRRRLRERVGGESATPMPSRPRE